MNQQTVPPQADNAAVSGPPGPAIDGLATQNLQTRAPKMFPRTEPPADKDWPRSCSLPPLLHARDDPWEYRSLLHVRLAILIPFLLWVIPPSQRFFYPDRYLHEASTVQKELLKETAIRWLAVVGITFAVLLLEKAAVGISGRDTTYFVQTIIAVTWVATMIYWFTQTSAAWMVAIEVMFLTGFYLVATACVLAIYRRHRRRDTRRPSEKSHTSVVTEPLQSV